MLLFESAFAMDVHIFYKMFTQVGSRCDFVEVNNFFLEKKKQTKNICIYLDFFDYHQFKI